MSIKIGSKVEVFFFEEQIDDAPASYIGAVGEVFSLTRNTSGEERSIGVSFDDEYGFGWEKWDFKPEQLKVVEEGL